MNGEDKSQDAAEIERNWQELVKSFPDDVDEQETTEADAAKVAADNLKTEFERLRQFEQDALAAQQDEDMDTDGIGDINDWIRNQSKLQGDKKAHSLIKHLPPPPHGSRISDGCRKSRGHGSRTSSPGPSVSAVGSNAPSVQDITKGIVDGLAQVFGKFQAPMPVPTLEPFEGNKNGSKLTEFLETYEIQFRSASDADKITLMACYLKGRALSVYRSLDADFKKGSFDQFKREFRKQLIDSTQAGHFTRLRELESITKGQKQTWRDFIVYAESKVREAVENGDIDNKPSTKDERLCAILLRAAEQDPTLLRDLTLSLDKLEAGKRFHPLKTITINYEKSLKTVSERTSEKKEEQQSPTSERSKGYQNSRHSNKAEPGKKNDHRDTNKANTGDKRDGNARKQPSADGKAKYCKYHGSNGHSSEDCRDKTYKCFNCGKPGHRQDECPDTPKTKKVGGTPTTSAAKVNSNTEVSDLFRALSFCKSTVPVLPREGEELKPPIRGKTVSVEASLLEEKVEATLDTGSSVSLAPMSWLKETIAKRRWHESDMEKYQPRRVPEGFSLKNASGDNMDVWGTITLPLEHKRTGRSEHCFLLTQDGNTDVIVGTNVFDHSVAWQNMVSETLRKNTSSRQTPSSNEAVVSRRVYLQCFSEGPVHLVKPPNMSDNYLCSADTNIMGGLVQSSDQDTCIVTVRTTDKPVVIDKGTCVGKWESVDILNLQDVAELVPKVVHSAGSERCAAAKLQPPEERGKLVLELLALDQWQGSKQGQHQLKLAIVKHANAFSVHEADFGRTSLVEHRIDTGDAQPIRIKSYPVPLAMRPNLEEIVRDAVEKGVLSPSRSPWNSPIVLVRKKDGTIRMCTDFRALNKVTKMDHFMLPNIDLTVQSLHGKKFFSSLDLHAGYWQVPLSDDSKEKTAFSTPSGKWEYNVLPMGLCDSSGCFERLMESIFGDLIGTYVFVYLDDILVATEDEESHIAALKEVFTRLEKAGLRIKPKKCSFGRRHISFLGHVVGFDGVRPDPDKIAVILNFPTPTNLTQLRSFIGMVSYYRKFIKGFARIAAPLFILMKKDVPFTWTVEREDACTVFKKALCEAPVLAQPDIESARNGSRPFVMYTDASTTGLGAVLMQQGLDNHLHPVYYASKSCSRAERNYSITDLEALAVVFAARKFKMFIMGTEVIVRTDHQPLVCLFKRNNLSGRMMRWALQLEQFHPPLKFEYVRGTTNTAADGLSRMFDGAAEGESLDVGGDVVMSISMSDDKQRRLHPWTEELRHDPSFTAILESVLDSPDNCHESGQYVLENGRLLRMLEDGSATIVVPKSKRKPIFQEFHAGLFAGHMSAKKTGKLLRRKYWWPLMARDINGWSCGCFPCLLRNSQKSFCPPLKPIVATKPFEIVGIDLAEMPLTSSGMRWALVVIDHFTKFCQAYPIPDKKMETVAKTFMNEWVLREQRVPIELLSDQGLEFANGFLRELTRITGIQHLFTQGYNSRVNGGTERVIRTLKDMLAKKVELDLEWDQKLPYALFWYNACPHPATGESPFFLLHGFDAHFPNAVDNSDLPTRYTVDTDEYRHELAVGIRLIHLLAKEKADKYRNCMKEQYDKDKKAKSVPVAVGDRVAMFMPRERATHEEGKLAMQWTGPYRVLDVTDNSATVVPIWQKGDEVRVQFEFLRAIPPKVDESAHYYGVTKRKGKKKLSPGVDPAGKPSVHAQAYKEDASHPKGPRRSPRIAAQTVKTSVRLTKCEVTFNDPLSFRYGKGRCYFNHRKQPIEFLTTLNSILDPAAKCSCDPVRLADFIPTASTCLWSASSPEQLARAATVYYSAHVSKAERAKLMADHDGRMPLPEDVVVPPGVLERAMHHFGRHCRHRQAILQHVMHLPLAHVKPSRRVGLNCDAIGQAWEKVQAELAHKTLIGYERVTVIGARDSAVLSSCLQVVEYQSTSVFGDLCDLLVSSLLSRRTDLVVVTCDTLQYDKKSFVADSAIDHLYHGIRILGSRRHVDVVVLPPLRPSEGSNYSTTFARYAQMEDAARWKKYPNIYWVAHREVGETKLSNFLGTSALERSFQYVDAKGQLTTQGARRVWQFIATMLPSKSTIIKLKDTGVHQPNIEQPSNSDGSTQAARPAQQHGKRRHESTSGESSTKKSRLGSSHHGGGKPLKQGNHFEPRNRQQGGGRPLKQGHHNEPLRRKQ